MFLTLYQNTSCYPTLKAELLSTYQDVLYLKGAFTTDISFKGMGDTLDLKVTLALMKGAEKVVMYSVILSQ